MFLSRLHIYIYDSLFCSMLGLKLGHIKQKREREKKRKVRVLSCLVYSQRQREKKVCICLDLSYSSLVSILILFQVNELVGQSTGGKERESHYPKKYSRHRHTRQKKENINATSMTDRYRYEITS